jgi:hypothetical protein
MLTEGRCLSLAFTVSVSYHVRFIYRYPPLQLRIKTQGLITVYFSLKKVTKCMGFVVVVVVVPVAAAYNYKHKVM